MEAVVSGDEAEVKLRHHRSHQAGKKSKVKLRVFCDGCVSPPKLQLRMARG